MRGRLREDGDGTEIVRNRKTIGKMSGGGKMINVQPQKARRSTTSQKNIDQKTRETRRVKTGSRREIRNKIMIRKREKTPNMNVEKEMNVIIGREKKRSKEIHHRSGIGLMIWERNQTEDFTPRKKKRQLKRTSTSVATNTTSRQKMKGKNTIETGRKKNMRGGSERCS